MARRRRSRLFVLLAAISAVSLVGLGISPVAAQTSGSEPHPSNSPSYLTLDNNGSDRQESTSPCFPRTRRHAGGCANEVRIRWTRADCVEGRSARSVFERFPPVIGVVTLNGKPIPDYPPVIAPCSSGVRLKWDKHGFLTTVRYQGSKGPDSNLAYIPPKANDFELYFVGGDAVVGITWVRNGEPVGDVSVSSDVNDVFWYGYPPSMSPSPASRPAKVGASRAARKHDGTPRVEFFWRSGPHHGSSTASAPSSANDVDFGFYLNKLQSGPTRGCVVVGNHAWVSPAMPVEFLTAGSLNSRVVPLPCPMNNGTPVHYNDLDVSWSGHSVTQLVPTFNGTLMSSYSSALPQPPAGTDEFVLGFPIDNFQNANWTQNGSAIGDIDAHKGVKSATLFP